MPLEYQFAKNSATGFWLAQHREIAPFKKYNMHLHMKVRVVKIGCYHPLPQNSCISAFLVSHSRILYLSLSARQHPRNANGIAIEALCLHRILSSCRWTTQRCFWGMSAHGHVGTQRSLWGMSARGHVGVGEFIAVLDRDTHHCCKRQSYTVTSATFCNRHTQLSTNGIKCCQKTTPTEVLPPVHIPACPLGPTIGSPEGRYNGCQDSLPDIPGPRSIAACANFETNWSWYVQYMVEH